MSQYLWWVHIIDRATGDILYDRKSVGGNQPQMLMRIARECGLTEEKLEACHIMMHNWGEVPVKKRRRMLGEAFRHVINELPDDVISADDDEED